MKRIAFYISMIILFLNFSCKNNNKSDLEKSIELDVLKTTELITQILKDENEGYLSSNCISEKPRAIIPTEYRKQAKRRLQIQDTIHLNTQIKLYKNFKITIDLVPKKNILTQKQFAEFEKKSKNEGFSFLGWLETNCENGYSSISKPIFNKAYDLAYVQIGKVCGELCGGGEERIYEFVNGKWIEKESFGSWIS